MNNLQKRLNKLFGFKETNIITDIEFDYRPNQKTIWHDSNYQSRLGKLNGMYGKKHSKETLKKISNSKKGQIAFTYKWKITLPNGKQIIKNNLHKFCKENNLSMGNFVYWGHTKGYKAVKV